MRFINLGMPQRRAKQACLHCRSRKIRCDLAFGGSPCLNCRLDEVHCEVRGRKPKRRKLETKNTRVTDNTNTGSVTTITDDNWIQDDMFITTSNISLGANRFSPSNPSPCNLNNVQIGSTNTSPEGGSSVLELTDDLPAFIRNPDLSNLPPDDVSFLQRQGCLNVPPRPLLDEFIREYFLHVHPMLPLMDESVFWEQYEQETNELSLFLIQAMLFASCSFASEIITKELGFESPRLAAARFYQRAKLLYVLDIEPSAVDLARGALLLTFLPVSLGSDHPTPNSVWLTRAIEHAESLGASHAGHINEPETGSLKRLWWCCILRDRSISLGQRRSVQIPGQYPLPVEEDFRSEFNASLVYTPHIKAQLFRVFRRLMVFCYVVVDLLQLMARHRSPARHLETVCADDRTVLSRCREDLSIWFSATGEEFLKLGQGNQQRHPSVIVYTNFVYIQYYTAKLLLHHQKLIAEVGLSDLIEFLPSALIDEVRSATFRFIDHLSEPVRLGLARFLPISVAAFAAVPMAMHVFEARLGGRVTENERRLRILIEMLEAHQPRFEGIEPLSILVRQAVTSVESGLATIPIFELYICAGTSSVFLRRTQKLLNAEQ
ncbi:n-terminal binuclear Zn cluster-containing protein [Fusarium sp. NRRL 52700]|nr:n-terminal binuclear Zn cluster-containing protein [Fusarium sp. NRRL 52700]